VTEVPVAQGPPCDFCETELAIMSVMNLADWAQQRIGANCAPEYLRAIAQAISGEEAPPSEVVYIHTCPTCGSRDQYDTADISAHTCGHQQPPPRPAKPDPLTKNVSRSTHGNRRTRTEVSDDARQPSAPA
jgi:hypothetical protein